MSGKKRKKPEMVDAYDDQMNYIGVYPRTYVHRHRMWHKVVQCWVFSQDKDSGSVTIYLQRRSFEKRSHPGRYDITAGGHVSAGETPKEAVVRETLEETGLALDEERLLYIGQFREKVGNDCEMAYIYAYEMKNPPFKPGSEVIYMVSADLDEFMDLVNKKRKSITVTPAIRTGLMHEEAFTISKGNCSLHKSFTYKVYPYLKKLIGGRGETSKKSGGRGETSKKSGESGENR